MVNLMQEFENDQIGKLTSKKRIPAFRAGDTIKVTLKITEGERSRLQVFEGVCIARKNNSVNSKFTVRKMSHGEGVERVFPLFSPNIDSLEVIRKGDVKRAKLYYLRERTGKSARIADRDRGDEIDQYELVTNENLDKEIQNQKIEDDNDKPQDESDKIQKKDINETKLESVAEDQESSSVIKESESTASEAENTDNESKS